MHKDNEKRILVATDFSKTSGRDFFAGVLRYGRTVIPSAISLIQSESELTELRLQNETTRGLDGIITTIADSDETLALLLRQHVPLVIVGSRPFASEVVSLPFSTVTVDERSIGADAAKFMISLGNFATFAYVHCPDKMDRHLSSLRFKGFASVIATQKTKAATFDNVRSSDQLMKWLAALPKPACILCGHDPTAQLVLDGCRQLRLSVPGAVSVLGIDNDNLLCESTKPELSSVRIDPESEGFSAAEEMNRLLSSRKSPKFRNIICKTTVEVVSRNSTRPAIPAVHLLKKADEFIKANANRALTVGEVVAHLGVSRRLIDLRFRQLENESLLQRITKLRLKAVEQRLLHTSASTRSVANACGFQDVSYFITLFKRHFGHTPSAHRLAAKASISRK